MSGIFIAMLTDDQVIPIRMILAYNHFIADTTGFCFFATGRADQAISRLCELFRGDTTPATMRNRLIAIFAHNQVLAILNIPGQNRLVAKSADRRFLAAGGADHFASCRCELLRGYATATAAGNRTLATLTYNQPIAVGIIGPL